MLDVQHIELQKARADIVHLRPGMESHRKFIEVRTIHLYVICIYRHYTFLISSFNGTSYCRVRLKYYINPFVRVNRRIYRYLILIIEPMLYGTTDIY